MKKYIIGILMISGMICMGQESVNKVYDENCAKCHGKDGSGSAMMVKRGIKNYTDSVVQSKLTDEAIDKSIKDGVVNSEGKQVMKSFPDLTVVDRKNLIKTIRSFKK